MVRCCETVGDAHTAEENCTPRSDVTIAGTPKRDTHPVKKASAQAAVVVEESGTYRFRPSCSAVHHCEEMGVSTTGYW